MKADLARRMPRPLPALGGHYQGRDLHPFSVNHAAAYSRKCVVVRRNVSEAEGEETRQAHGPSMIPTTYGGIAVGFDVEDLIKLLERASGLRASGQESSSGEQQNGGEIEHYRHCYRSLLKVGKARQQNQRYSAGP